MTRALETAGAFVVVAMILIGVVSIMTGAWVIASAVATGTGEAICVMAFMGAAIGAIAA